MRYILQRYKRGRAGGARPLVLAALLALLTTPGAIRGDGGVLDVLRPDAPIDSTRTDVPHVEPHLAVHPSDPEVLLAGAIVVAPRRGEPPWHCAAFRSADGGSSWQRHDFAVDRCIDPWALLLADGTALLAAIEIGQAGAMRLLLFRSDDGGRSWSDEPLELATGIDHELLLAHPNPRTGAVEIELAARRSGRSAAGRPRHAVALWRSVDGGRTFTEVAELRPSNLALNATGLVRRGDGTLFASWIDFQRNVDGFDRLGMLEHARAWIVRSADGGATFSAPLFVSEGCDMASGFPGYPALAAAPAASRWPGRLVHLCVGHGNGLELRVSDDDGERWDDAVSITPPASAGASTARTPMLAIGPGGSVAVAWYALAQRDGERCQTVYTSLSRDGGSTFGEPVQTASWSCPLTPGNGRVADSWPMGGDYGSLAAAVDGVFHLLFADSRTGVFQIRHTSFRASGDIAGTPPADSSAGAAR